MDFNHFDPEEHFRAAWSAVAVARPVHYSLFTFGESELPYWLIVDSSQPKSPVQLVQGMVRITRPLIITPQNASPELENFFEDVDLGRMAGFLMSRTAAFSHLKFNNQEGSKRLVSDSTEELVAKLNKDLDHEEEDRTAILTAPHGLGGLAVLRYATERIFRSAADNIQELRERGFLPNDD